jgi:tRNA pseudouridine32 synthase/23S rRNA pseudouridine746 synthase
LQDNYTFHEPPACDAPLLIIHADADILVVHKPAGLLSVPGRIMKDCVLRRAAVDYPQVRVVHRLDLDTSGLMVLGLSQLAVSDLNRQFRERLISKEYVAEVYGIVAQAQGEIDLPIAPDPLHRPRQKIDHMAGKAALTRYAVIHQHQHSARLRLMPLTGRSHQLRLHLAAIGHPILGCDLYAHEQAFSAAPRLMLHAQSLGFSHPQTGQQVTYSVPPEF